jgi:cell division septation protein DedD
VSEFSHDAVDDGFHEIQLSGKQLVFLFMATTVVSVVIFLCGVLVGRGVHIAQPAEAAQVPAAARETAPPPSSAPGSVPPPASDPQPVAQAAPPPATSQAAAPPSEAPAPPAGDELTYRKRLEGEGAPAEEKLKPSDASKAPDAPKSAARTTPKASPPPEPAPTTGGARPGTWVVQLAALRDRAAAASIVQRLSGRGYPAYIVNPSSGAPTPVYRVQVGRYDDRHEAEQVARRLEKEEKFNTWISR